MFWASLINTLASGDERGDTRSGTHVECERWFASFRCRGHRRFRNCSRQELARAENYWIVNLRQDDNRNSINSSQRRTAKLPQQCGTPQMEPHSGQEFDQPTTSRVGSTSLSASFIYPKLTARMLVGLVGNWCYAPLIRRITHETLGLARLTSSAADGYD